MSSASPIATASPCLSRWLVSRSSLCAAQWPKSSGLDEPCSNGSPAVAMCCRCSAADCLTTCSIAVMSRSASRGASSSMHCEERVVLDQRGLDRLRQPAAPVAIGQRRQERRVVDDGKRRRERAEVVLLAERVDAVLDADRRSRPATGRSWGSGSGGCRDAPSRPRSRRRRAPRRRRPRRHTNADRARRRGSPGAPAAWARDRSWPARLPGSPAPGRRARARRHDRGSSANRLTSPGCASLTPLSTTNRTRAGRGATALGAAFRTSGLDESNTSRLK